MLSIYKLACFIFDYRNLLVTGGEGFRHHFSNLRVVARTTKITYVRVIIVTLIIILMHLNSNPDTFSLISSLQEVAEKVGLPTQILCHLLSPLKL